MSTPEPHAERDAEVRRWVRYAREDLRAAQAATRAPDLVPRHACLLAQQAAEKVLKAALVYLSIPFRRIRDLDALRNLLPPSWSITREALDLAPLTLWAVESRYPGDLPDADTAAAATAVATARTVYERTVSDLEHHGFALTPHQERVPGGPSQPPLPS
jgi:HEPN domain-containing protein